MGTGGLAGIVVGVFLKAAQYVLPGVCVMAAIRAFLPRQTEQRWRSTTSRGTVRNLRPGKEGTQTADQLWQAIDGLRWWEYLILAALWWIVLRWLEGIIGRLNGRLGETAHVLSLITQIGRFLIAGLFVAASLRAVLRSRTDSPAWWHSDETSATAERGGHPSEQSKCDPRSAKEDKVSIEYRSPLIGATTTSSAPQSLAEVSDVEVLFDVIEWRRFEALVERCMQLRGFSTSSKSHGPDGGVDIKLYHEHDPDELLGVVQCKHWGSALVGVEAVRALRGAMAEFKTDQGFFATSSTYTTDARAFAKRNGIEALDRYNLIDMILSRTEGERDSILRIALQGRYDIPTCASCGTKMVKRKPRLGGAEFWGCMSYPRCRSVIKIGSHD